MNNVEVAFQISVFYLSKEFTCSVKRSKSLFSSRANLSPIFKPN